MPLQKSRSEKAFIHNVRAEMDAGKPQKQSLAIAYSMKKRAKKMAGGGKVCGVDCPGCDYCMGEGRDIPIGANGSRYAEGGPVGTPKRGQSGYEKGVHQSGSGGTYSSTAGDIARSGTSLKRKGIPSGDDALDYSKQMHANKLDEMRSMKKPNLYAEGGFTEEEEDSGYQDMPVSTMGREGDNYEEDEDDLVGRAMKSHYSEGGRVANDTKITAGFKPAQYDDLELRDNLEGEYPGSQEIGDEQEDDDRRDIVSRIMRSRSKRDRMPRPA